MLSAEENSVQYVDHEMLKEAERKFKKSCGQIFLLNKQLEDMQERYRKAKIANFRCFRYNLRLKLAVVEGTRNMFYEYAYAQADVITNLRWKLFGQNVEVVTADDEESDMESDEDGSDMETDEYSAWYKKKRPF